MGREGEEEDHLYTIGIKLPFTWKIKKKKKKKQNSLKTTGKKQAQQQKNSQPGFLMAKSCEISSKTANHTKRTQPMPCANYDEYAHN